MTRNLITFGSLRAILVVLAALAALAALPGLAAAQSNGKFTDQKSNSEQAVRKTLDELYAALGRNDAAALDRIYAEDYTLINESGELTTKAPRLAAIRSGELKYESIKFDDYAVRVHGETAVATYHVMSKAKVKGQDSGGDFRVTATFIKMKGSWRLLAAQVTRVGG